MQIIPQFLRTQATGFEALDQNSNLGSDFKANLFNDFMDQHMDMLDQWEQKQDLGTTVSTVEEVIRSVPEAWEKGAEAAMNTDSDKGLVQRTVEAVQEALPADAPHNTPMTAGDFEEVRGDLREMGMSQRDINELEEKVNSEEGLTWGQFVNFVAKKLDEPAQAIKFSADENQKLLSLFSKLGFNAKESEQAVTDLAGGKFAKVFQQIQNKLDSMPQDSEMTLNKGEVQVLVKALKLPQAAQNKINELLSQKETFSLKEVNMVFSQIKQELANKNQARGEAGKEFTEKVSKLMNEAKEQGENLLRADNRNLSNQKEVYEDSAGIRKEIKDATEEANGKANPNAVAAKEKTEKMGVSQTRTAKDAKFTASQAKAEAQDGQSDAKGSAAQNTAKEDNLTSRLGKVADQQIQDGKNGLQTKIQNLADQQQGKVDVQAKAQVADPKMAETSDASKELKSLLDDMRGKVVDDNKGQVLTKDGKAVVSTQAKTAANNQSDNSGRHLFHDQGETSEREQGFKEFISKLKGDDGQAVAAKAGRTVASSADFSAATTKVATAAKTAAPKAAENISPRQTMEQVQDAFLKNLSGGRKQLTVKLNPVDLGQLNVVLQVSNKEVQATIRADNPETAKLIADNLNVLKDALIEQGLKVAKVEVQMNMQDGQSGGDWQGAKHHNEAMLRKEAARMRSQWRTLRQEGTMLAQDVQTVMQQARNSQAGIHVIA